MADETRDPSQEAETNKDDLEEGTPGREEPEVKAESQGSEETPATPVPDEIKNNHIAQKRGRMVAAGVIASVILAVIAVAVAGIFQLTSGWLIKCPSDLPVNDPAPVLWKSLVSDDVASASLGVPKELMEQARWKGSPGEETSSEESK
ncbi:MAG: hypothetical protein RDU20_00515 [Desulfomonilaceae bacterium]|nr:hypothetical protein [Desulfomonilaceae bacterium]